MMNTISQGYTLTKFELDISEVTKVEDTSKVYDLFGAGQ